MALLKDYDVFYQKMDRHPNPRNAGTEREAFAKSAEAYQGGLGSVVDPEDTHWRDFVGGAYLVFNKGPGKGTFLAEPTGLYWALSNLTELRQMEKQVAAERSKEVTREREMALETAKSKSAEAVKAYEQKKREFQEFKAFQQQLLGIQNAEVEAKLEVDQRLDQEAEAKVRAYIATPGGRDLVGRIESLAKKIFSAREQNRIELEKKLKPFADEEAKLWKLRADPNTTSRGDDMVVEQIGENRLKMSKIAMKSGDTRVTAFDADYSELVRKFELGSGIKFNVAAPLLRRLAEEEDARSKKGK